MNKKLVCMIITLCMCTIVGCGKNKNDDITTPSSSMEQTTSDDKTGVESSVSEDVNDNTINESETNPVEEERLPDHVQITEGITAASGKTINNGGEFVQIGDLVYLRQYGPDGKESNSLSEDFSDAFSSSNSLLTYNCSTGELNDYFYDSSFGGIYFYNDRFFFTQYTDADYSTMCYSTASNGSDRLDITDATIIDIYEKKGILIISRFTEDNQHYYEGWSADRDSECLFICGGGANTYYTYHGIVGSYMFIASDDHLYCVDLSDDRYHMIDLGSMPKYGESPSNVRSIRSYQDKYYVCTYIVEGSASFLVHQDICSFGPKQENSIKRVKENMPLDDSNIILDMHFDPDGEPQFGTQVDNDIYVDDNSLMFDSKVIYKNVWNDINGDGESIEALTDHELVGDKVFAHIVSMEHDEENDIGWRYSYRLNEMKYVVIDLNGNVNIINDIVYDY